MADNPVEGGDERKEAWITEKNGREGGGEREEGKIINNSSDVFN